MIDDSTFSLVVEGYEYTWKVKSLLKAAKKSKEIYWKVPDSFLSAWAWGEDEVVEHIERCLNADLKYPVIVWDNRVLDGCHRVVKSLAKGQSEVRAKVIRDIPAPDFVLDVDDLDFKEESKHSFKEIVEIVKVKLNQ